MRRACSWVQCRISAAMIKFSMVILGSAGIWGCAGAERVYSEAEVLPGHAVVVWGVRLIGGRDAVHMELGADSSWWPQVGRRELILDRFDLDGKTVLFLYSTTILNTDPRILN